MDFFLFKIFITPTVLVIIYNFGAVIIPILVYFFTKYFFKKIPFLKKICQQAKIIVKKTINWKYIFLFWLVAISLFFWLELLWRIIFEFLLAYFQIWEVLVLN